MGSEIAKRPRDVCITSTNVASRLFNRLLFQRGNQLPLNAGDDGSNPVL